MGSAGQHVQINAMGRLCLPESCEELTIQNYTESRSAVADSGFRYNAKPIPEGDPRTIHQPLESY
jgi:hypothetical protein